MPVHCAGLVVNSFGQFFSVYGYVFRCANIKANLATFHACNAHGYIVADADYLSDISGE